MHPRDGGYCSGPTVPLVGLRKNTVLPWGPSSAQGHWDLGTQAGNHTTVPIYAAASQYFAPASEYHQEKSLS